MTESSGKATVKSENDFLPDRAEDRRTRRHKQAIREEELSKRQRDGKKPFYLTLDAQGKPYGPGKPAWIQEIGKLATGLDLSCTHISRQTYEAVTTLKSRLNESFEYSGTLNEDNLKLVMGKAVSRKRRELIALIKKGGSQPVHIDHEVWERLLKLAASKQHEEKSEQGRYANSCRITLGRTGRQGVNGVIERLREKFKRSPDPDEIEEEMNRDKGFGGYAQRKVAAKLEKESVEVYSSENSMGSSTDTLRTRDNMSDDGHGKRRERQRKDKNKVYVIELLVNLVDICHRHL